MTELLTRSVFPHFYPVTRLFFQWYFSFLVRRCTSVAPTCKPNQHLYAPTLLDFLKTFFTYCYLSKTSGSPSQSGLSECVPSPQEFAQHLLTTELASHPVRLPERNFHSFVSSQSLILLELRRTVRGMAHAVGSLISYV